jgi:hypothetical protein
LSPALENPESFTRARSDDLIGVAVPEWTSMRVPCGRADANEGHEAEVEPEGVEEESG